MTNDFDFAWQLEKIQARSVFNQMLVKKNKCVIEPKNETKAALRFSEIQTLTVLSGTSDAYVWSVLEQAYDE